MIGVVVVVGVIREVEAEEVTGGEAGVEVEPAETEGIIILTMNTMGTCGMVKLPLYYKQ